MESFGSNSFSHIPLPDMFKNSLTGESFQFCVNCNSYLLNEDTNYLIEKAYARFAANDKPEVFAEYAICLPCYQKRYKSLSADSLQRIERFFQKNVDFTKRKNTLLSKTTREVKDWIANCVVKNSPVDEGSEYQLIAHCVGKNLVLDATPFVISASAVEELWALLSSQTQRMLDDFKDEFAGLPPELRVLLKEKHICLV